MKFSTLDEWLLWLESLHPKEIDLGLERVEKVAERMGLLSSSATVITVAGTNGKGSFVKAMSDLFVADGKSFGAYTSPHILHYNERITVNGEQASDDIICEAFEAIDQARADISLSYFEFGTLAALYVFNKIQVDYILLEVGLGGRLDAVNILDADIGVITSIGMDHEAWLGNDRESIGREKAGILRKHQPCICVEKDIPQSVRERASELECEKYFLGENIHIQDHGNSVELQCSSRNGEEMQFSLHQHQLPLPSLAAAIQCYSLIETDIDLEKISRTIEASTLAGRFEIHDWHSRDIIMDVAHNPQAAELLADKLKSSGICKSVAIFTCMEDKNLPDIVSPLQDLVAEWVCTSVPNLPRGKGAESIADTFVRMGISKSSKITVRETPKDALNYAKQSGAEFDLPILIFGSFFLIAEIKPLLSEL